MGSARSIDQTIDQKARFVVPNVDQAAVKTAFVLAGGGSLGAIQAGMLRVLAENNLRPDLIVGASVGAINAAHFAGDPTVSGVERLATLWRGLHRREIFPVSLKTVTNLAFGGNFLIESTSLRHIVKANIAFEKLEDSVIPIHIVATDLLTGDAVVMATGDAVDAVLASSAIPAAFPPVRRYGRYLVDAAVTSNTPVRIAVACGARRLIVLPTGFVCALAEPPRGAIANALQALTLLIARQLVAELEALGPEIDYAIVPTLCPLNASPYDFSRSAELIEASAASTRAWVDGGGLNTRVIPNSLRPHNH